MTKSKKEILAAHGILAAVLVIFIAAGTFFDPGISWAVYMPKSPPFLIITLIGEAMMFSAFVYFDAVLMGQLLQREDVTRRRRGWYLAICGWCAFSTGGIGAYTATEKECLGAVDALAELPKLLLTAIVFAAVMVPPFVLGLRNGRGRDGGYDGRLAGRLVRLLIFITITAYVMALIKTPFSRPRYRTTLTIADYLPWYKAYDPAYNAKEKAELFGAEKNDFRAFPSGHAIMAMSAVFIFPAFAWVSEKLKGREKALAAAGLIYALAVMFSRIVLGAHFLTDVSAGALVTVVISCAYYLTERKSQQKEQG